MSIVNSGNNGFDTIETPGKIERACQSATYVCG